MSCVSNLKAANFMGIPKQYQNLVSLPKINFCGKAPNDTGDTFIKNSQKTPEYFFHFTNEETAKEIIESGSINTTCDGIDPDKEGVFMVDLKNLINKWTEQNIQGIDNSFNLLTCLLGQIAKGGSKISCFKIPAERLNDDIFVRSQKDLIEAGETGVEPEFMNIEDCKSLKKDNDPIEYMHSGKIPVSKDDLVGTVELPKVLQQFFEDCDFGESLSAYGSTPDLASMVVVEELLKNEPEIKDIKN